MCGRNHPNFPREMDLCFTYPQMFGNNFDFCHDERIVSYQAHTETMKHLLSKIVNFLRELNNTRFSFTKLLHNACTSIIKVETSSK